MLAGTLKIAVGAAVGAFVAADLLSYRPSAPAPQPSASAITNPASPASGGKPSSVRGLSYGRVEIGPDRLGQYHAVVEIDGRRLPMLVDTGASYVALTYVDAAGIGLRPMPSDFNIRMQTANGTAAAAAVRLRQVRLDTILVDDVPAIVMPRDVTATSLLGMSFLRKLGGFEIAEGRLVLKP